MAKSEKNSKVTPLMKQYFQVKAKHPDAILLFRVGDFYETFAEDAVTASSVLGIVLTSRNNGGSDIELAGFPFHSLDNYLPRLVKAGYRVAICEQLEKPGKEKKIVRRGITEIVTPGLAMNDKILDHKSNNFLASLAPSKTDSYGLAMLDISTGEFFVSEGSRTHIDKLFQSLSPSEIIFPKSAGKSFFKLFGDKWYTYPLEDWIFSPDFGREKLIAHFEVQSLKGFGIENMEQAQVAAGAILHYLSTTENKKVGHINAISRIQPDKYVWLDRFTIRNLELLHSSQDGGVPLLQILDNTVSPMGGRLMKKWVVLPLKNDNEITARLDMVDQLVQHVETADTIEQHLRQVGDLERLISKVPMLKINPREVRQLHRALSITKPLREILLNTAEPGLMRLAEKLNPCNQLIEIISKTIVEDPPLNLTKGNVIAAGISTELDELRHLMANSKQMLVEIQHKEAEKTGITNLKIGFNNVFGYYLEVTNKFKNQGLIPDHWVRKQTLTNAERYISDELKQLETKILGAEEKMLALENKLFEQLIFAVSDYIQPIQLNSAQLAILDCILSFARVSLKNRYNRPEINDSLVIDIKNGRHPVIEKQLPLGEEFVPNDVFLDNQSTQIMMITGPNMSGKSALLRQTALICLMAQMGCFVPADSAAIGLVDKIFTRVGASDNISSGESTFMVEMNETASIMNNISPRSLILLDEIGRGTSTYDGISIAWAIAEFLHTNPLATPKTLFATHYHELNELAEKFDRIHNFHVSTKEVNQKVLFLRKLKQGGSEHSFGIHVARMAGMPRTIVQRAGEIMSKLEQKTIAAKEEGLMDTSAKLKTMIEAPIQLSIFETADPNIGRIKDILSSIEINAMTPVDCMIQLVELKKLIEKD